MKTNFQQFRLRLVTVTGAALCLVLFSGCGLIGVNQIAPAPRGENVNNAVAPDGTRPGK